jgi:hypothetical protein
MKIGSFRPCWFVPIILLIFFPGEALAQAKKEGKLQLKEPALLTSAGQSADTQMVKVLLDKNKIAYQFNLMGGPDDLKAVKSLILVIGGSTKGMGAAGIDADKEAARVQRLLAKAKELKIPIVGVHIGGKARRGDLSDRFINLVIPSSSHLIVVKEGDWDQVFSQGAAKHNIPIALVNRISEAQEPLTSIFGK